MIHRIRAAGLLVHDSKLLLVLEKNLATGSGFWTPPGGGLEAEDGSAVSCVQREFREETGLSVEVGDLVYVREFAEISRGTHHLELFFRVHWVQGHLHITDPGAPPVGTDLMRYARWFSQSEMQDLAVAPRELKRSFWEDALSGITETRYLGVTAEETSP
ncbi:MAG: NUDIX hydrolase [Cytophagales bacterium]|nr:NUDIX hydrolase [Armatimonadota bacterium]